ncbi:2-(1,2-epoxy-1,2-dihydrophenyl)acetyl-CoA isomerase [Sphingorhabdus soli]|uniref:2-(1,2-epoxy-1,2-dihydrophenyl)acetyl-CoA isomerase n=1 Tax=Flavisphingopyxis soli TaxID=2601267 RepID=A0A5C6U681_9SPHN|nr:2-(1,2-epoxy-1,2-dihydrophenyl)acetyl-CoA isomerase PaaG [Sphingorhabdus soli]TXC68312.1 2-(1,2-epoxy-1,2-dihydrophenyl)acetyl-CoA isomerase [Sphingorhabdus soli]
MTFETIEYSSQNGLATITLNRPDRLNSFNVRMHEEVRAAFDTIKADDTVRAVLLTGAGRGFCAGQDLGDRAVSADNAAPDLGHSVETYYNPLIRRIAALPMPVVCAVNGVAAGAGANIALACDVVIAARSAKFIQSFANIGLIPDSGGTWILPRLIGQARAMGLALTGEPLMAEAAAEWGLIWKCVDDEALIAEATALAEKFAAGPTRGLAETKKRVRAAWTNDLDTELDEERDAMRMLGGTHDYAEGVAAFTEKRKPSFTGR